MFRPLQPVTQSLLILNILLYIVTRATHGALYAYLPLYPPGDPAFQPFQLITYMFMHGSVGHVFFNMLALWMFGSDIEQYWGQKKFLSFYMICGLFAAGTNLVINYFLGHEGIMLGASGAIMGILAAYGFMFPNRQLILLFPPIPVRVKYMVIAYGALDLYAAIANNPGDDVAHFAHLGGLAAGAIILLYWKRQGKLYN